MYVLWRFYQRRADEREVEGQLRQLTILQNQSVREMRQQVHYRRLSDEEEVKPPLLKGGLFRKFWK